ncbi:MAG: hypothetical protein AAGK32_09555 [Actinomycetota bacterium]
MSLDPERSAALTGAKLRALVGAHLQRDVDPDAVVTRAGGAGVVVDDEGWYLPLEDSARTLGPALTWADAEGCRHAHLLSDDAGNAAALARRAAEFASTPTVWTVDERTLVPAVPAPSPTDTVPAPSTAEFVLMLESAGVDVVVEHGVVTGEVDGLEIARVLVDDQGAATIEVGVGRHDREAFAMIHGERPVPEALAEVAATVARHRSRGAEGHPLNRLAPSRRLRTRVLADPALAGATVLVPVPPALPRDDLREDVPAAALGETDDGEPVVVVCSVGIDLDLVPEAADVRATRSPAARLRLLVPARDAHERTRRLAAALGDPAEVLTVHDDWPHTT